MPAASAGRAPRSRPKTAPEAAAPGRRYLPGLLALAVMALAVCATYFSGPPPQLPRGEDWTLSGIDYISLHARRLHYAQEALLARTRICRAGTRASWAGAPSGRTCTASR